MSKIVRFASVREKKWLPTWSRPRPWRKLSKGWIAIGAVGLAVAGLVSAERGFQSGCDIKGNISARGERIYHLPGQAYYEVTRIDFRKGERRFCSEQAARKAGWRRARN